MANQYTGSKWSIYDEQIKTILYDDKEIGNGIVADNLNLELDARSRDALSIYIKRNRRRLLDDYEGVYDATEIINVANKDVPYYWDKTSKEYSFMVKNPNYEKPSEEIEAIKEIDFLSIFKDKITPIEVTNFSKKCDSLFDRLVLSDIHIGMDVNKDGYSLYDGNWNEEILFERLEIVVKQAILNQKSNLLVIHDLGDYLDGFDGFTTRGGHKLPQNMDNQKMFDVGLKFKIKLIDSLINHFRKIQFVNICNDNHAGSFGYIVNSAFKAYIELKYPNNIEVINQRKFIDHYIVKNTCFILTHGKDDKSLKFGFKPVLDTIQIEKIKNYIDEYKLYQYKIEFSKGDSHQLMFDLTSSTAFEYQNFGAFSPPSDWVKTNFKNTISCFTHFNYYEEQKTINNFIFKKQ